MSSPVSTIVANLFNMDCVKPKPFGHTNMRSQSGEGRYVDTIVAL